MEALAILSIFSQLSPQSLVSYLSVLHCTLEDRLYQTDRTPAEKQRSLAVCSHILDLVKQILPCCSLSPFASRFLQFLLTIAKQATAISLVEKAVECVVILVEVIGVCDVGRERSA